MSNIQIESDLKEILNKLDGKLDNLQKDVTDINLRLTKVETKLDSTVEDIKEIKGSQKAQIWTLIGVLITAVGGFVVAVGRSVFSFNP
jgi:predicted nuclease with TOPRIM domain